MKGLINSAQEAAVKAHKAGNNEIAAKLYKRVLAYSDNPPFDVFANYGALLRSMERAKEARVVYRRGIAIHKNEFVLLRNFANLELQEGFASHSLALLLHAESIIPKNNYSKKLEAIHRQQAQALSELGYPRLALRLLEPILNKNPKDVESLSLGMAELYLDLNDDERARELALPILSEREVTLNNAYQSSYLLLKLGKFQQALKTFEQATESHLNRAQKLDKKTRQNLDTICWNFSLMLLRRGLTVRGWELYEHGRAVPNGRGGMQRTVFKSHPRALITEWGGGPLNGKRLLINGEQGIGDVMMFAMLLQPLLKECSSVGIITYDRLMPIFERSFPSSKIFGTKDLKNKTIEPSDWDTQVAIGSLPRLRYPQLKDYDGLKPYLVVEESQKIMFSKRFNSNENKKMIGFSWRGGGNAKQKRTKSLKLEDLLPLFTSTSHQWISLQYGDVNQELRDFNEKHGLNIIIAEDVDPLKDMDRWCSLVSCCDQVISVANTTIHGAGCIGIPTTVILAKEPDWRWLGDNNSPCYWYPTVKIARQHTVGSWKEPINEILYDLKNAEKTNT